MKLSGIIDAAAGRVPADLVLKNITTLMVTTGEWVTGDLAVAGDRIIGAGPETYCGRREIDCRGKFAVPGFIDAHIHLESSHILPAAFETCVLPHGTTTAICDPHELANVCGKAALRYFLDCAAALRMDLFVQLSSCVPATPLETSGAELSAADLAEFRTDPHFMGLAEFMNVPGLLMQTPEVLAKINVFTGEIIGGHAPLLSGKELNAYLACGIGDDHECSSPAEAMEKLRKGMTVFIREGSVARNLDQLYPILTNNTVDLTALCTDDKKCLDLQQEGTLDSMIRRLTAHGIAPELVYRAASLSAARHFRLYDRGMLAPGKLADIVLLDNVRECRIHAVLKSGKFVNELPPLSSMPDHTFALHSIRRAPVTAADFRIRSRQRRTPIIELLPDSLLTNRIDRDLPVDADGIKSALPEQDILKICVLERHGKNGNIGRGFVRGFGLKHGALASSVGHDSHNLCVVGVSDDDMALAVNTLIGCGGGYAAVSGGKVLGKAVFSVGGLMSELSIPEAAQEMTALYQVLPGMGCSLRDPFMQLAFLPLPVIPCLKITDRGVVDVEKFTLIEV